MAEAAPAPGPHHEPARLHRGGTGPKKQGVTVDRYCISPQLAPPMISPQGKKIMDRSEDYHAGRGGKK